MPMLSENDKSFGDSIAGDEGIMGDDGGIMGLNGGDSIMGSVGDSIMGEESIYGLGASSKLAEVAIQIMDAGKPVADKAFTWKLKVSTMQEAPSSSPSPRTEWERLTRTAFSGCPSRTCRLAGSAAAPMTRTPSRRSPFW
jgi:hypothetical protein